MTLTSTAHVDGPLWIKEVPTGWSVAPLGSHFEERKDTVSARDFAPLSVTKAGVVPQLANVAQSDNADNRKLVRAGDLAINSRSDRKGSSGLSDLDGSVSVVYTVLTPRDSLHGRFAHHLFRSQAFQEEFYRWGSGIVADLWSTRYSTMKQIPLAVPPLQTQHAIAVYLDRETAKIDTLIAKQEQLIVMLRARRGAAIASAVFEGLDGAPLQENDEPWLPQTPSHWPITQLGFVSKTLAGWAFPSEGFSENQHHTRLLRGINVKPGATDWSETVRWDERASAVPPEFALEVGDLVLGMDRPFVAGGVRIAAIAEQDLPALLLQRVMRIRPSAEGDPGYVRYVVGTSAFSAYLEPLFTGVSVPHMSEWQVRKFKMPFPPIDEQRRIVSFLDENTAKIDRLIAKAERFIELAKERRAALITAAVTGQIDVRGEVA